MFTGFLLVCLGLFIAPVWDAVRPGPVIIPYCIGLGLVLAGDVLIAIALMKAIRARGNDKLRAQICLFGLTLTSSYLGLEGIASASIVGTGQRMELFEFRRRQRFENEPLKISHPFLVMTNNPKIRGINSLGFLDREWPREKQTGTIRIACLGASTSEDGYPQLLQEFLSSAKPEAKIEVRNFGNAGWTSAQNLINYSLNVKYFSPDYVLIHEAVNEVKVRGYDDLRTDYSHAFKVLSPPLPRKDAPFVRYLNSYAFGKFLYYKLRKINPGVDVYTAIIRTNVHPVPLREEELGIFRENILEIIRSAEAHGSRIILTTQPYSKTNLSWGAHVPGHMVEANEMLRSISAERGLKLVDLDKVMQGHEEYFVDPVHLSPDAIRLKASTLSVEIAPMIQAGKVTASSSTFSEAQLVSEKAGDGRR